MTEKEEEEGDRHPDDYNVNTFREALEDARRTHDQQLQAYNDVNDRNWRVLRFNGIIATVSVAAAASVSSDIEIQTAIVLLTGTLFLSYSSYRLIYKTPVTKVTLGPSKGDLKTVSDKNPPESVYLDWMVGLYSEWTESVKAATKKNSDNIELAKLLSVVGTALLIGGGLLHVTYQLT